MCFPRGVVCQRRGIWTHLRRVKTDPTLGAFASRFERHAADSHRQTRADASRSPDRAVDHRLVDHAILYFPHGGDGPVLTG